MIFVGRYESYTVCQASNSSLVFMVTIRSVTQLSLLAHHCNELDERSTREVVILASFGYFTLQVVPFRYGTYAYRGEIDNEQQSSAAVARKEKGHKVK
jgi:hypothetical protein